MINETEYQHALNMIQYHEKKVDQYKAITRQYHQAHELIRITQRDQSELKPYKPLYQYESKLSNSK